MLARLFGPRKIATPLLDACRQVDERVLNHYVETAPFDTRGKKGTTLSMLVMMGTASLVDGLKWEATSNWAGSEKFWRRTNMDVAAAEAIVFLTWALIQRYHAAARSDRPSFLLVGIEAMSDLGGLTKGLITSRTGADFKEQAIAARTAYQGAAKAGGDLLGPLTGRILACHDRASLSDPPKRPSAIQDLVSVPVAASVGAFIASMPPAYWDVFVGLLREMPQHFPRDDDDAA